MTITDRNERRGTPRRATDRVIDALYTSYSSSQCHSCLQKHPDGIILLNEAQEILFVNPQIEQIAAQLGAPFVLNPKFELLDTAESRRMTDFMSSTQAIQGPQCQLLSFIPPQQEDKLLLLTYFHLPKTSDPNVACYLLSLRDPSFFSIAQWQMLTDHFKLTPTETRLCHALADGLSISDYCEKWRVTDGTARGQLHNIFTKTSTRRQSDLLRLIFLFTRVYG